MKKWVFLLLLLLLLSVVPASLFADESSTAKQVSLEIYPKWYSQDDITIQGNIGVKKTISRSMIGSLTTSNLPQPML